LKPEERIRKRKKEGKGGSDVYILAKILARHRETKKRINAQRNPGKGDAKGRPLRKRGTCTIGTEGRMALCVRTNAEREKLTVEETR